MKTFLNIIKLLKETFALNSICSIFNSDAHNIVSEAGWEKLNEDDDS